MSPDRSRNLFRMDREREAGRRSGIVSAARRLIADSEASGPERLPGLAVR